MSRGFLAVIVFGLALGVASAQVSEKLVRANDPAQITDAVMITNVSIGNSNLECGLFVKPPAVVQPVVPFQASNNWLREMSITLINRTNKVIVAGTVTLQFLDTGDCRSQPCFAANVDIGHMPAVDAYDGRTGKPLRLAHPEQQPLDWRPGQLLTVHISDHMGDVEQSIAGHLQPTAVNDVAIHIGPFFFADGMRSVGSYYSVPDPEHHGKYKYLPYDYFPGNRGANWPPGYSQ
jgi:hypothetical protein